MALDHITVITKASSIVELDPPDRRNVGKQGFITGPKAIPWADNDNYSANTERSSAAGASTSLVNSCFTFLRKQAPIY